MLNLNACLKTFARKNTLLLRRWYQLDCKTFHTNSTTERIKWTEDNLSSQDISNQIQLLFQTIHDDVAKQHKNPFTSLLDNTGFSVKKDVSTIKNAGYGLFLEGRIAPASVVSIYPGVLYNPGGWKGNECIVWNIVGDLIGDPSFFPSLRNDYVIKRNDGSCVDGKYWGLSKYMYKSLAMRDGPESVFDNTWHHVSDTMWREKMKSPFAMGQMINNCTSGNPNVTYFEFEFSAEFPQHLWYLIPNISYQSWHSSVERGYLVKGIAMITLREIFDNEELFSDYCWVGMSQNK